MIIFDEVISEKEKRNFRLKYRKTLTQAMDEFWAKVIIGKSRCYKIYYNGKMVGHCSITEDKKLVQFYISKLYFVYAPDIFKYLITSKLITGAMVATFESQFLSLCLDNQKSVYVEAYLFVDNDDKEIKLRDFKDLHFRFAIKDDIKILEEKCDYPFKGYYQELIDNKQAFVLYNGDKFLGLGEFRINEGHPKYADLGVFVVEEYRRRNVGTYIIYQLKKYCYKNKVIPIASCDSNNIASKKTLEKAGLITENRIINVSF